ncbi:SRPBCC family protein [Leptospira ilyithenensis]|uniref:Transcriptional regulator n=1 Tax=Leptospira ilyithenensis TaxID=2484901 RepID=A0A4R9LVC7_9LEPT|nr:SRPBCC family protein [Leptospira ilyithenensis]TGN14638.1 transcriptional regulator [Leptospira ilyithenensis]
MKVIKFILLGLLSLILVFLLSGFFLPSEYGLERTIFVQANKEKVFDLVNDVEKNQLWSPWRAKDPEAKITFGEKKAGLGASYSWVGSVSGSGSLTITKSEPFQTIENHLDFGDMGKAEAYWKFSPKEKGMDVTWGFTGKAEGYFDRYFGVLIEPFLGPDYEAGLSKLKAIAEE